MAHTVGDGADPATGFVQRLRKRRELWWGNPFRWGRWRSYVEALRRLRDRHTFRRAGDPDAAWRCGRYWQRTLINKWNGREFAKKHGARVPDLYWWGRRVRAMPFPSLPSRFVIRPVWGRHRRGVHVVVDGRELFRGESASPTELRRRLRREGGLIRTNPLLVEQFVESEDGCNHLPVEYKCHVFGGALVAVGRIERTHEGATVRVYTPEWEPFPDPMNTMCPLGDVTDAPPFLPEMNDLAVRMGEAIGTYMRIDFFGTERGCVFNEFSSTPMVAAPAYTRFSNEFFERHWQEKCPDAS